MFKNYFLIALRNIRRHKGFSFIKITGLAVGIAVCVLILHYVRFELSFDNYHQYKDRIYRIERQFLTPDGSVRQHFCSLAPSFIPHLSNDFTEIEHIARIFDNGNTRVTFGEKKFLEDRFYFAEHNIFEIFTIPLKQGNSKTALIQPGSLVITESMAKKYFEDEDPMGKRIEIGEELLLKVTGVMSDVPINSHLHFDFLASYITLKGRYRYRQNNDDYFFGNQNFTDNVTYTYIRIARNADPSAISALIPSFIDRYIPERIDDAGNSVLGSQRTNLYLRLVSDIHLHSHTSNELEPNSDIPYVALFALIAVCILIIACINFMNLSTAQAANRAREVGLRKVVGANRRLLITQFIGKSLLVTALAMILAVALVFLFAPYFRAFLGYGLSFELLMNPAGFLILAGIFILSGLGSGFYPAIYLSAFRPVAILKVKLTGGSRRKGMRKVLVVFQFSISAALIISVGVIFKQMIFLQNANLGFEKENIVLINADDKIRDNWREVKRALLNSPRILAATASKRAPSGRLLDAPGFSTEVNGNLVTSSFTMPHNRVEHDFFKTYGMKFVAGRDFSIDYPTDETEAFILNETAVRMLGWLDPEKALDAPMSIAGRSGKIIGIVADFNYEFMHHKILPILTYLRPQEINTVSVRVSSGNVQEAMAYVKKIWDRFDPGYPISYTYLDERLNELYRSEARMMQMFGYFSLLAIFIACLGLFGLISFTTTQRTKEIGIRKVLGASVLSIVCLLSGDLTKFVLIANVLSWPIVYFFMNRWLNNFAYRVPIDWKVFALSASLTFVISLVTVSYQSIRAARSDPVNAIRYE
ncbi:ABC transporter permease [Acidobacteriota bacterium]